MLSPSSQQKEKEKKTKIVFYLFRLLDICHGQRREREMSLYLVFEHVHQDLASYLEKCPPPGLPQDRIKVNTSPYKNAIVCVLKSSFNYFFFGSDLTEKSHSAQKMDKLHTKLYLGRVRPFIFYI